MLLFMILGFVLYSNTFRSPFLFDGWGKIVENPHIHLREITWQSAGKVFTGPTWTRPLPTLSFALNYYFGRDNVFGYHLVNILIHIAAGFFLFLFLKATLRISAKKTLQVGISHSVLIPLFAALLWFVHPLATQSVTYIIQRMNSMSSMFYILSFWLYIRGREAQQRQKAWFAGCVISGIFAVLSKEIAVTLPFFIFLYEWFFFQGLNKEWLRQRMKWIVVAIIPCVIFALFHFLGTDLAGKIAAGYTEWGATLPQRILTELRVLTHYLSLIFFPNPPRLAFDYAFPFSRSLIDPWTTLLSLVVILGLSATAFYTAKKRPLVSFCILWYFGNLILEVVLIALFFPSEAVFEHRTYLPSMLVIFLFVVLVFDIIKQKRAVVAVCCMLVFIFSVWTYQRNGVYKDTLTLFSDTVKKSKNRARVHYCLGDALQIEGRYSEAIASYMEALRLKPNYAAAHNNWGNVLQRQDQFKESIPHYRQALRIEPDFEKAFYNMGNAFLFQERYNEAIKNYKKALHIKPKYAAAHNGWGNALQARGEIFAAIKHYTRALQIDPAFEEALYNRGNAFLGQGQYNEAIKDYTNALRVNPDYVLAHNSLGNALYTRGQVKEAIGHYRAALRIDPGQALPHYYLGNALSAEGQLEEAVMHYTAAVKIKPDFVEALYNMGNTRANQGQLGDALGYYVESLRINPDYVDAHNNLGFFLMRQGRLMQAINHFRHALKVSPNNTNVRNNLKTALGLIGKQ